MAIIKSQLLLSSRESNKNRAVTRREITMGTYTLKTIGTSTDYMTIVREMDDGYVVRIVRDKDGYEDVTNDYISKALFDSCVRTGYLTKVEEKVVASA